MAEGEEDGGLQPGLSSGGLRQEKQNERVRTLQTLDSSGLCDRKGFFYFFKKNLFENFPLSNNTPKNQIPPGRKSTDFARCLLVCLFMY
jgi:hypothetical protein